MRGHIYGARSATFAPDGQTVLTTGEDDSTAWLLNVAPSKEMFLLRGHSKNVGSALFSPDGRKLVTASSDKTARLWSATTGEQLAVLDNEDQVNFAFFSPDGKMVTTWSRDGMAKRWDVNTGTEIERFLAFGDVVKNSRKKWGLAPTTADWRLSLKMAPLSYGTSIQQRRLAHFVPKTTSQSSASLPTGGC